MPKISYKSFFFSCTGGKYIPKDWDDLTDIQRINKLKKEYGKFYKFTTFETFAKEIKTSSNEELTKNIVTILSLSTKYII